MKTGRIQVEFEDRQNSGGVRRQTEFRWSLKTDRIQVGLGAGRIQVGLGAGRILVGFEDRQNSGGLGAGRIQVESTNNGR